MIPVRPGDDNEELRYTLRGIAAHVPHRQVWIVGHRPRWVSDEVAHIAVPQTGTKWENSRRNRMTACLTAGVAEHFYLFNDDFFVLAPVSAVPLYHRGPVAVVEREYRRRSPIHRLSEYMVGMEATRRFLVECGVDEPLSYELHVPMPVTKTGLLAALDVAEQSGITLPHVRTLYGNLAASGRPGAFLADVKYETAGALPPDDAVYVSSNDRSFAAELGVWVHARLPDPCRYELADEIPEVA